MSWEVILTAAILILRLCVAIVNLAKALLEMRIFAIDAGLDPVGVVEIQIDNKVQDNLEVRRIHLVQDRSIWRLALRRLIGIDSVMEFTELKWTPIFSVPATLPPRSTSTFRGEITDTDRIRELRESRLRFPMTRIEIAGRRVLARLHPIQTIVTEGDFVDPSS